ncbi:hypothetical protein F4813DRAFT_399645 [Daldinia decipiens]|uniref:uncharacterized protein n=1 Tax=Daldinia decipiens TaxID=326647 RepID=UPI0020C4C92A|nr:uncharacterized protein F4813DRAFT_399645 [Daldinia decipiens]KAI1653645.1 hypothetical protein F4813DRAFT_399645 [Daldinia decipiens]
MGQMQSITMRRHQQSPAPTLPDNTKPAFLNLPLDIIYIIYNSFLDPVSKLTLTLTCKDMFAVIPIKSLPRLDLSDLGEFLHLLEKDMNGPRPSYFCRACTRLHYLEDTRGDETIFSYSHAIKSNNGCCSYYGAPGGLALSAFEVVNQSSYRQPRWFRKWSARIIDDELFLSSTQKARFVGAEGDFRDLLDRREYQICAHTWTMQRGVGFRDKEEEEGEKLQKYIRRLQAAYDQRVRMDGGAPEAQSYWYNPQWGPGRTVNSFRLEKSTDSMLHSKLLRQCRDVPGSCLFCDTDYTTTLEKRKVGHWWERGQEEWVLTIVTYHQLGHGLIPDDPTWIAFKTKYSSYTGPFREEFGSLPRSVKEKWDESVSRDTAE